MFRTTNSQVTLSCSVFCCLSSLHRSQLLQVTYLEQALPHEQLQVSVLHEGTGRLLLKGAVPLSCLIPGQHYSLAVALSDVCSLYLTLVLGLGELECW
jgi:hypothetical protein